MNDKPDLAEQLTSTEVSRVEAPYSKAAIEQAMFAKRGPLFDSLPVMVEAAKLMARSGIYLPPHCRENPGACFAVLMKTQAWGLPDPFFMAEHSYVVTTRDKVERIAYDGSVFQAALMTSGAVRGRPQYEYTGEGDAMTCTVSVIDARSGKIESYTTPPLSRCKGHSPLWVQNPQVQFAYYALRNLVRIKYQDVLAGFYDRDEFEEIDITPEPVQQPNLMQRLPGRVEGEGFQTTAKPEDEATALARAEAAKKNRQEGARRAREAKAGKKPAPEIGVASTKQEYIDMVRHTIRFADDKRGLYNWYVSEKQARLRQTCKVDDQTAMQLLTLTKDAATMT